MREVCHKMKKLALPIIIGLIVVIGGLYYVINPVEKTPNKASKNTSNEVSIVVKPTTIKKDHCAIVESLGYKGSCMSKPIKLNNEDVSLINVGDTYGILLNDDKFQEIQTEFYYEPKQAVAEYLKNMGVTISDIDWENVTTELQMSKRGYLLGLNFKTPKQGIIYISPNGRITGKLK